MKEEQKEKQELSIVNSYDENTGLQYFDNLADVNALREYCEEFVKGELCPFNRVEDVMAVYLWSRQKNLSWLDCLAHLTVINGKVGVDAYLTRALLQRKGVFCQVLESNGEREDFRALYWYHTKEKKYDQDHIDKYPDRFEIYITAEEIKLAITEGAVPKGKLAVIRAEKPYDYRTRVKFTRMIGNRLLTELGEFKWTDAIKAGLVEKSNWENYPKECLYARAYTKGARRIATDYLAEHLTWEELATEENVTIDIDHIVADEVG